MQIWDTAGQEKYRSLISHSFKSAHGAFIVFDLTNKKSFDTIKSVWLELLKKNSKEKICIVVLANKCDKIDETEITKEELEKFEKETNIKCFLTSAKDNIGITEAFHYLAQKISENFFVISPRLRNNAPIKLQNSFKIELGGQDDLSDKCC